MRTFTKTTTWLLPLALALALALAGCGGGGSPLDPDDPFGSAAENTVEAGTEKTSIDGSVTFSGQTIELKGNGAFDNELQRGELRVTLTIPGQGNVVLDEVYNKLVAWIKSPRFQAALPEGKEWIRFDLAKAGEQIGYDVAAVMGQTPTDAFAHLRRASTEATEVGEEEIDGVETTHYRADVDTAKLAADARQKASDPVYKPLDMWVDGDGLVRRVKIDFTSKLYPTEEDRAHTVLTIDLTDFGTEVAVALPPAGKVVNATDVAGG
jgi:hypothetical protein